MNIFKKFFGQKNKLDESVAAAFTQHGSKPFVLTEGIMLEFNRAMRDVEDFYDCVMALTLITEFQGSDYIKKSSKAVLISEPIQVMKASPSAPYDNSLKICILIDRSPSLIVTSYFRKNFFFVSYACPNHFNGMRVASDEDFQNLPPAIKNILREVITTLIDKHVVFLMKEQNSNTQAFDTIQSLVDRFS